MPFKHRLLLKYLTLPLFLLISFQAFVQAQTLTISGFIKDGGTGEALPSATISIPERKTGTRSNDFGFYSITLPKATYTLQIRYVGYQPIDTVVDLEKSLTLNFKMKEETTQLEEIVITDDAAKQTVQSSQMSMISLPMSRIKQIPVMFGEADPIKVIQLMPGVRNNSEGNAGFFVRGGGADQNLVLLDGSPVYNASHLFGFFSVFNPDAVKGVELYKGGFPSRYGGRISSVLDIQMKDGNTEKTSVSGGIGLIASRLTLEGPIGKKQKGSWIISGRRTYLDAFTRQLNRANQSNAEWNRIPDYYFYDLNLKATWQITPKDKIFLSGYLGKDVFGFDDPLLNLSFGWGNKAGTLRWNKQLSPKLFLNQSLTFSDYQYNIKNSLELFSIRLFSGIRDYGYKAELDYLPSPNHTVKAGVLYTYHELEPGGFEGNTSDGSLQAKSATKMYGNEWGAYVQDDWEVNSFLKLNYGFRLSGFVTPDTQFVYPEPRISTRLKVNDKLSFKASYSRMAQYLHLVSNSSISLPTDLWFPATRRLSPQLGDQIAGGFARLLAKNKVTFTYEVYYKWMQNQVEYREGAQIFFNPNLANEFVSGRGWSYGNEFLFQKTEGKWTGWLGYTLSWTWRQFPDINMGNKFPARHDRRHDIVAVFTWNLSPRALLSATFVYATGNAVTLPEGRYVAFDQATLKPVVVPVYPSRNTLRMPDYHRGDIGFTWKFDPRWGESDLTFSIYNIYNRRNPYIVFFQEIRNEAQEIEGFEARQVSLFPIIPAVTWNFKF
jgi:hypothetical protein